MAIVFDSDAGTITGLSVGGLPDGIVDSGTLAANSVDSAELVDGAVDNSHLADNAVDSDQLADNAVGLAQMASGTDGNIITYDTSGNPAAVATGSSGQILTSAGADAVPAFEAAAGGGKVLQVVSANYATEWSSSSTTYTDTGLTATITPSATSSKILVLCNQNGCGKSQSNAGLRLHLYRDATKLADFGEDLGYTNTVQHWNMVGSASISYLDSPSSTSAVVYKTQANNNSGAGTAVRVQNSETTSTLTLIEIGA